MSDLATKEWAMKTQDFDEKTAEAFAEEYSLGDDMYLDDNHCECANYIVGNNRCECGNRRVSIGHEVSVNGFYYFSTEVS